MKATAFLRTAVIAAVWVNLRSVATTAEIPRCDLVYEEVRAAVAKDPPKILVIVEDAMVANETCACEIVKGAIAGSRANAELRRQIALTASHIAPNMAPLIAECAGASSPEDGKGVVETVKEEVGLPLQDGLQPTGPIWGGDDYLLLPDDIRGVYLIQPSSGGVASLSVPRTGQGSGKTRNVVAGRCRPRSSVPQSPSVAMGP